VLEQPTGLARLCPAGPRFGPSGRRRFPRQAPGVPPCGRDLTATPCRSCDPPFCARATVPPRGKLAMGNKFSKQIERAKVTNELDIRYAACCRRAETGASCLLPLTRGRLAGDLPCGTHRSYRELRACPKGVFQLKRLETLNLAGNHISELPAALGNLKSLRSLDVDGTWLALSSSPDGGRTVPPQEQR